MKKIRLVLTAKELYIVLRSLQAWTNMLRLFDLRDPYLHYSQEEVIDLHGKLCKKYAKRIAKELGIFEELVK